MQLCIRCTSNVRTRIALFPGEYFDPRSCASSEGQPHTPGSHSFRGNTSIRAAWHQPYSRRAHSKRALSREIRRSVHLCMPWGVHASSAHHVRALGLRSFPGNTSICPTSHQMNCTRSDRALSLQIRRSAQLGIKCASRARARIALFPGKYLDLHDCAPSAQGANAPGSRSFPANTSIRAASQHGRVGCARSDRTIPGGILRSGQRCL